MNILQKSSIRSFSDKKADNNSKAAQRPARVFGALLFVFIVCVLLGLMLGSTAADMGAGLKAALAGERTSAEYRVLMYVRLPRVLGAVLSGAALAAAGVLIQAVLNNAMAAPNIIGVNSGAGLAATLLIALSPASLKLLPLAAFLGALAACLCIYAIALKTGASRLTITLVGISISSILSAGINTVKTLFPDSILNANAFLVGGLSGVSMARLIPAGLMIAPALVLACFFARDVDVLSLGEETAEGLGMNVKLSRFAFLVLASVLAGSAVSFAGLLGFVGLLSPHIARRFVGGRHRYLLPFSAFLGACLVLLCDLLGRLLFAPYELPVGIILSFVGGPFFLTLILGQRRQRSGDRA